METRAIIDRLYPAISRRRRWWGRARGLGRWLRAKVRYVIITAIAVVAWMIPHIYYYNRLIALEFDVQAAWAHVETEQQRRYHIQQNLVRTVVAYARHERSVLTRLTRMRTRRVDDDRSSPPTYKPPPAASPKAALDKLEKLGSKQLDRLMPQIQLMAEQYPKLRLTENFQQLTKAVISSEDQIAKRLIEYNRRVNMYTTLLEQFPGNIFAKVMGFESYAFHRPNRRALEYRPVVYGR